MPISITCSCGKVLRAPDEFAGRRVKCPACGAPVTVSAGANAAGAPARTSTAVHSKSSVAPVQDATTLNIVRFKCSCGKGMQANAQFAGRLARCPGCGENVIIPRSDTTRNVRIGPDQPTPMPASPGRKRPPVVEEDVPEAVELEEVEEVEEVEEAEEPETARPERPRNRKPNRRTPNVKKSGAGRVLLWMTLILLFLLVVGGSAFGTWWFISGSGGGATDDLVFVPGDAPGVFSFRPAEIQKTPIGQKLMASVPPSVKKSFDGPDVERVTCVIWDVNARPPEDGIWAVIKASKPIDKEQALKEINDVTKEQWFEGKKYYAPSQPTNFSIWFAGPTIAVLGREASLKRAMKLPPERTHGPLDNMIAEIENNHHLVLAMRPNAQAAANGAAMVPGATFLASKEDLQNLTSIDSFSLIGDAAQGVTLDLSLAYASDAKAKDAKGALDKLLQKTKTMLAPAVKKSKDADPSMAVFVTLLQSIKPVQNGSSVGVRIIIEGDALSSMIAALGPKKPAAAMGRPNLPGKPMPAATAAPVRKATTSDPRRVGRGAQSITSPANGVK